RQAAFLNDNGELAVWRDRDGFFYFAGKKREINLARSEKPPVSYGWFGVDPGGRFCFAQVADDRTEIARVVNPGVPVATSRFVGRKLFAKNEKLYLFGNDLIYAKVTGKQKDIVCDVFQPAGARYALEEQIRIPRPSEAPSPYYVLDMDPLSDSVLISESWDTPLVGSWWLLF